VHTRTRVTAIETIPMRAGRQRVSRVRTDRGDVDCEIVVDCGGMLGAEIGGPVRRLATLTLIDPTSRIRG
jgi:glycine/D-amino acid oxidase-like deaminating enzyme